MPLDESDLREGLTNSFNPTHRELNAVVREAIRLSESGEWERVSDQEFTAEFIVKKLEMADRPLKDSWNWWMGSLDYIQTGFRQYQVDK